ncbi:unnamed protein product, partial [marine sediment metagenome]
MKKLLLPILIVLLVLGISSVSAVCTMSFDKDVYNKGETAVVSMSLSEVAEKNKFYQVNYTNQTAVQIWETDNGTTPNSVDEVFLESFTIPSDYTNTT